ncbi:MAG TPA: metal ABC transporter ATP-binding protein [Desulfurococcales archaeon]|nr:metal ABC transporter ATP-binding protein [Desulfurococcales archaeon]
MCTATYKSILRYAQGESILGKVVTLTVEGLTVGYNGYPVVRNVCFSVKGPALVQILGPNGAGKTTLLRGILGLLKPIEGRVLVDYVDVTGKPEKSSRYFGYVPQLVMSPNTMYPITAWELLESTYMLYRRRWPRLFPEESAKRRIMEVLEAVGLPRDKWYRTFWKLSGGERQRVLIAQALINDPPILLMDEPLSAIDPPGRVEIAKLIRCLKSTKLILVTSHDPTLLLDYTDYIILINRERFRMGRPDQILVADIAEEFYGGVVKYVKEHLHIYDSHT